MTEDDRPADRPLIQGPALVVNPPNHALRPWAETPATVSITGIVAVAVLEGLAIQHGLNGAHFYTALTIIAAICGIHMRFAPILSGSVPRK